MPTRRGTTNRKTGKTTPRSKPTTHWGGMKSPKRAAASKKPVKAAVAAKK